MYKKILSFVLVVSSLYSTSPECFGVVMAGGGGKRLWPISRVEKPKQFISIHDDKALLECTLDRILPLVSPGKMWVVTTQEHEPAVIQYGNKKIDRIVSEPAPRNTAPAILTTILDIYANNPEAILFFVPADHYIPNSVLFRASLKHAIDYAACDEALVLIGIQPHRPATEYGYIEYGVRLSTAAFSVKSFHEKPIAEVAEQYLKVDTMLWNTGIFCGKVSVFIEAFKKHAPKLYEEVLEYRMGLRAYSDISEESFDKAVLEKTEKCAVVPAGFKWSDVGNLEQFLIARHEKKSPESIIAYKASNNLIDGTDKLVVLIDVHDLCVIETQDVLLISRRSETDKVKDVLEMLKKEGLDYYL